MGGGGDLGRRAVLFFHLEAEPWRTVNVVSRMKAQGALNGTVKLNIPAME